MKILSIVGARPQFIKLGPLSTEIRKHFNEIIVHTGQHFDAEMSDLFFNELNIAQPDVNLHIHGGNHGEQTGRMLIELEKVVLEEKPDLIIVFGDTNTTIAGALVGAKLHIPIVHVEAGLRSFNKTMPEEINRIAADHVSDFLFAPTQTAMDNLENEGLAKKSFFSGDIMVDAVNHAAAKARQRALPEHVKVEPNEYYLCTLHRPYNVDDPKILTKILSELAGLPKQVVFPIHPRTRKIVEKEDISIAPNIVLTKPAGYLDFVNLQMNSHKIITDSGGIQKEAFILKKPCITLRSETEWIETVIAGWNLLLNPATEDALGEKIDAFTTPSEQAPLFGHEVAFKMVEYIQKAVQK